MHWKLLNGDGHFRPEGPALKGRPGRGGGPGR